MEGKMLADMILEAILLLNVLVAVRCLIFALQKLFKRKFNAGRITLVLYFFIFYTYCEMNELILRDKLDEYMMEQAGTIGQPEIHEEK